MTPLQLFPRRLPKKNFGLFRSFFPRHFSAENKIISVEERRAKIESNEAPTIFPSNDFNYDYQPMSIFEEKLGISEIGETDEVLLII